LGYDEIGGVVWGSKGGFLLLRGRRTHTGGGSPGEGNLRLVAFLPDLRGGANLHLVERIRWMGGDFWKLSMLVWVELNETEIGKTGTFQESDDFSEGGEKKIRWV